MKQHLNSEQIALLIEGEREHLSDAQWQHLSACPRCFSAYSQGLELSVLAADAKYAATLPLDLPELSREIPTPPTDSGEPAEESRIIRPWLGRGASVLAAAAVLLLLLIPFGAEKNLQNGDRFDPIRIALAVESGSGMILPGIDMTLPENARGFRDGGSRENLTTLLAELAERYTQNDLEAEEAYWLIAGYIASGDLKIAETFLKDARKRYPRNYDLLRLQPVLSYRFSDVDRAETLLRQSLARQPHDPYLLFNLAVLLNETGRVDESKSLVDSLCAHHPQSFPARRAAATLP